MKQQENMLLSRLTQYEHMYLRACNKIAALERSVAAYSEELAARDRVVVSMEGRIRELEELPKSWEGERLRILGDCDRYKQERDDERASHVETKKELERLREDVTSLREGAEALRLSKEANVDFHSVVQVLQRRMFHTNSDATAYMKGEVEFDERRMKDMNFKDVVEEANKLSRELVAGTEDSPIGTGKEPELPLSLIHI